MHWPYGSGCTGTARTKFLTSLRKFLISVSPLQVEGASASEAALEAATTRLRPVVMTALAMILGVIPMALGHGEGGEQNAPLGRAVIGGLILGTFASLFIVPLMFSLFARVKEPDEPIREEELADATTI